MPVRRTPERAIVLAICAAIGLVASLLVAAPANALVPTAADKATWGPDGRVRSIVETPTAIYVGGDFHALVSPSGQSVPRSNIAAIDPVTGNPLPFAPAINKPVFDIAVSPDGSTVYASGTFTKVGSVARGHVAAFNVSNGALLAFDPQADATVEAVVPTTTNVFIGGDFLTLGSTPRSRLAKLDLSGHIVPTFTTTADAIVHDMTLTPDGSQLVVGGLFDALSGNTAARRFALVNPTSGAVTAMAQRVAYETFGVYATSTQIFAAAGGGGGHAYAYSLATRQQQWLSITNGDVHAVREQDGVLYIGGHFTDFQGNPTSHVAAVSPETGEQIPWSIKVNSNLGIFSLGSFNGHLSLGGDFTKINNIARSHYARFSETVDTVPPTTPGRPTATASGSTTAHLVWAASTDNKVTNITYNVFRDSGSTPVGQVTSSSTTTVTYDDSGMAPGSTHTWRVQANDGSQNSPFSPVSNSVTLTDPGYPVLTSLQMLDTNANGKVDRVTATFSANVVCTAPCKTPWTLAHVPSNGTLNTVTVSGNTATLTLTEGSGAINTAVGGFTVSLAQSASGIRDASNSSRQARFPATAPTDKAGPVPTLLATTNGAHDNVMEDGDTFTVTFSEPLDPSSVHADNVKELDQNGLGNDEIIIVGLTDGAIDLGSNNYVTAPGGTIVFAQSTLTLLNGNTALRSTIVGLCTGTSCGATGPGANGSVTFRPEPVLSDLAGNGAVGSRTQSIGPY